MNTEWISVKERLPDIGKQVLLYSGAQLCSVVGFRTNSVNQFALNKACFYLSKPFYDINILDFTEGVTHWMPLPEPPNS